MAWIAICQSAAALSRSASPVIRARAAASVSTSHSSPPRNSGTRNTSRNSSIPKMTLPMPIATSFTAVP